MKELSEILNRNRPISDIISDLQRKSTTPPNWKELKKYIDPNGHEIKHDRTQRRDRVIETDNGSFIEEAARIALPLEALLIDRINQFTFTIPVKREYMNIEDSEDRKAIAFAMEKIYEEVDIDAVNIARGKDYFTTCEMFTLWYTVSSPNTLYGFESQYKLKCRTFSPQDDNVKLYPIIDEYGDMVVMSVAYKGRVADEDVDFFETWTKDRHYRWKSKTGEGWTDEIYETIAASGIEYGNEVSIGKIPGIYAWKKEPTVREGTTELRKDAEYKHSEQSDILAYNVAPLIKVVGKMLGDEKKYESRRLIRVEQGGNVEYVSWNQATQAADSHTQRNIDWFWMFNQMPDVSFKNLQGMGNIGYDARQMMFTDAFLRVGEESKPLLQFMRRESNVIKAFLKEMNKRWKPEDIDAITVRHTITPYIPKDEKYEIEKRLSANGGKPIESQRESIARYGKSKDIDRTLEEMQRESESEQAARMANLMEGAV